MLDLYDLFAPHFPLGKPPIQLEVVRTDPEWLTQDSDEPAARVTIRVMIFDIRDDGVCSLRDVKEQILYMGWPVLYKDRERVAAYLQALGDVLAAMDIEQAAMLMPHDIVRSDVLKLKKPRTRADFEAALRVPSRLGRYVK